MKLSSKFLLFSILNISLLSFSNVNNKSITFICFMAADNDLFPFAGRNLKQMQSIGSNERIKIVVHLDMHRPGQSKTSKRFFIEKNKIIEVASDLCMDSGDPATLIDCCKWAITNYPSDEYVIVLWNHGTGPIEPGIKKAVNPSLLFNYNQKTKLIELNRSIGFLDYIKKMENSCHTRGICFDDTTGNYLTNIKLKEALTYICKTYLNGKKFALIACDACLMAMIEVASPLATVAEYFVASQEVELGTGYNYTTVLSPFLTNYIETESFAKHIVNSFTETYNKITHDFTQSAYNLSKIDSLIDNMITLCKILIHGLINQKNRSVKEVIKLSKSSCTRFDEPTYYDLGHFLMNLNSNLYRFQLKSEELTNCFKNNLAQCINQTLNSISDLVIANTCGKNLKNASGISIYFPESIMHSSYKQSEFAQKTQWLNFLLTYFKS